MFILKRNFPIPEEPGWIPDKIDRRDYRYEEIFGTPPAPVWEPIDPKPEPMFPMKNQNGSSSCVGHAISKAGGVLEYYESGKYRDFSARFIYAQRSNKPGRGMIMREGMMIGVKQGFALESLLPSYGKNEKEMNITEDILTDVRQTALVWKADKFFYIDNTFDNIAALLAKKLPVIIGVAGTNEGWKDRKGWVRPPRPGERVWYHAMVVVPENKKGKNFGLIHGRKTLIVDNSWGLKHSACYKGQVFFTEEYLPWMKWNFYFTSLPDDWRDKEEKTIPKPKHKFLIDLSYGMKNHPEVKALQECLKWLGMFPKNIKCTGNFYSITLESVQTFQATYKKEISKVVGYKISCSGYVGVGTRTILNKIFG